LDEAIRLAPAALYFRYRALARKRLGDLDGAQMDFDKEKVLNPATKIEKSE
jgi:hypothetical protein